MLEPLLIEIGVEELPAIPFLKELPNIEKKWNDILEKNSLECNFEFFYTPRRLTLWHREFPIKQTDKEIESWGAPKAVAQKNPKAIEGFAKKNGVNIDEVGYKTRGNSEFLYIKKIQKGKDSKTLLPNMIKEWLKSLNFGKTMRWGSNKEEFIRPIRWAVCMMRDEVIEFELFGIRSSNITYGHRNYKEAIFINFVGNYFCELDKKGVVLYQDHRKKSILDKISKIETQHNVKVEIDNSLLDEVVTITEYPTPLLGTFDKKFLQLPNEVIITSMKEHQRYFPVYKDEKLANYFVVISNAKSDDFSEVISGNERVIRARLSDALFFWENDLKNGFDVEGLKNITYMDNLGTIYDKVQRERKIGSILADKLKQNPNLIDRAIYLSKADLLSEMVFEFTELQGIMGYYYAQKFGEDENVSLAIKEQYQNKTSNTFSAIVAISSKLDTIMSLFSIGLLPKGNKDPFALRRNAIAIINIIKQHNLNIDIKELIETIKDNYQQFNTNLVIEFIFERLYQLYKVNPSIIKAVLASGDTDILEIDKKIKALNEIVNTQGFKDIFITFKRVANIVQDVDLESVEVDEKLFIEDAERRLYKSFKEKNIGDSYIDRIDNLFSLKTEIDLFFDNVIVNVEDEKLKTNRKNLIASIYKAFTDIADIKHITI